MIETREDEDNAPTEILKYKCRGCGYVVEVEWQEGCPSCGRWYNAVKNKSDTNRTTFAALAFKPRRFMSTGIPDVDRVFGGGVVKASTIMLGGEPGGGKSTLAVQISGAFIKRGKKILYASGEQTREDVAAIAMRAGVFAKMDQAQIDAVSVLFDCLGNEDSVYKIVQRAEETKPALLVVDSLQTVQVDDVEADFGSTTQCKAVANVLTSFAKDSKIPIICISQITKSGDLAGAKAAEHVCDAIFSLSRHPQLDEDTGDLIEESKEWRLLECLGKNRNGPASEIAMFNMTETGMLVPIRRPGKLKLVE